jgi:hypothetical protein
MNVLGFSPSGELGDKVELPEQLPHHLTGIVAPTEGVEVGHDPLDGVLGLRDGDIRVVLALTLQTPVMLEELFAEEVRQTLAGRPAQWTRKTWNIDAFQAALRGH